HRGHAKGRQQRPPARFNADEQVRGEQRLGERKAVSSAPTIFKHPRQEDGVALLADALGGEVLALGMRTHDGPAHYAASSSHVGHSGARRTAAQKQASIRMSSSLDHCPSRSCCGESSPSSSKSRLRGRPRGLRCCCMVENSGTDTVAGISTAVVGFSRPSAPCVTEY